MLTGIYIVCAIVGGGLLFINMVLGHHGGADGGGFDHGVDMDHGVDLDHGPGLGHVDTHAVGDLASVMLVAFSPRNIIFFSAFFGLSGWIMSSVLGRPLTVHLPVSLVSGFGAAFICHKVFRWVVRTGAESSSRDVDLVDAEARVVLPISRAQRGKVRVTRDDGVTEVVAMLAPEFPGTAELAPQQRVRIVKMENGVALVTPEALN